MKTHLRRSDHSTWCGLNTHGRQTHILEATRNHNLADCKTCLKADAAEQSKEDAASQAAPRDEGDAL